jgi:hypothetical protein
VERRINDVDQERAEQMILQLSDFPTGWRATPSDDDEEGPDCFEFDVEGLVVTGRAESPDFEQGSTTTASSAGGVYESLEDAEKAYSQLADPALTTCITDYLEAQSDDEATVKDASVGELSFPAIGDASDARQIVVKIESEGLQVSAYVDLIVIQRERAVAALFFLNVLSPFDPEQEAELAKKVAARMAPS